MNRKTLSVRLQKSAAWILLAPRSVTTLCQCIKNRRTVRAITGLVPPCRFCFDEVMAAMAGFMRSPSVRAAAVRSVRSDHSGVRRRIVAGEGWQLFAVVCTISFPVLCLFLAWAASCSHLL